MDAAFVIALVAAIGSAVSLVLHVVAPKTKSTLDDSIVKYIDEALALIPKADASAVAKK